MSQYMSPYHHWFRLAPQQISPPPPPAGATALTTLPILPPSPHPVALLSPRRPPESRGSHPETASPPPPCPFFTRLPAEIRTQILTAAFGGRELHIDLSYNRIASAYPHSTAGAKFLLQRDWHWRSSVCHRAPGLDFPRDECTSGRAPGPFTTCDPADGPGPCRIGCLGWLLSCRQAYAEALPILYASNVLHSRSGALLLFGPRLVSPAGLACVASLTVSIERPTIYSHAEEHLGLRRGWPTYWALMAAVGYSFPALAALRVALAAVAPDGEAFAVAPLGRGGALTLAQPPGGASEVLSWGVFPVVDELVKRYAGRLRVCELVFQADMYDFWTSGEKAASARAESGPGNEDRFWRAVQGVKGEGARRLYPGVVEGHGYWVRRALEHATWIEDHDVIFQDVGHLLDG